MFIVRQITPLLQKSFEYSQILSLTGPRQSGKTTLLQKEFPEFSYQNLENPDIRSFALHDPRAFLKQSPRMIIDEVQNVPELLSYIQGLTDEDRKKKIILSGSQNLLLSKQVSQSLAGRVALFTLLPFSYQEILGTGKSLQNLQAIMLQGFYPRMYDRKTPLRWYMDYVQTYLERDVRQLQNIQNIELFHRFLCLCAGRVGQLINYESLSNDVGVSANTIKGWISVLQASYICFTLPAYSNNLRKRIIKSPKLYFYDVGLVCSLLRLTTIDQLEQHPQIGAIFENFIVAEHVKQSLYKGINLPFYFYRDRQGYEIDLLYEKKKVLQCIEIKYASTLSFDKIEDIRKATNKIGKDCELTIVSQFSSSSRGDVVLQHWSNVQI
jgi:predicted AAA+ superfamily ATPase